MEQERITISQRTVITLAYCTAILAAIGISAFLYFERINGIQDYTMISAEPYKKLQSGEYERIKNNSSREQLLTTSKDVFYKIPDQFHVSKELSDSLSIDTQDNASSDSSFQRQSIWANLSKRIESGDYPESLISDSICRYRIQRSGEFDQLDYKWLGCSIDTDNVIDDEYLSSDSEAIGAIQTINHQVKSIMMSIFAFNTLASAIMCLLPFLLIGQLLANSRAIELTYHERMDVAKSCFIIKFILGIIIFTGWLYILNPHGRGGSTYLQFFIAADKESLETLPIYLKSQQLTPILAGFFGWYLHLIGYLFTKLIHHDVVSNRVFNLLFKKFVIVYGIALVFPEASVGKSDNASLYMFLIGLFPLSAMSILMEAVSKIGSGSDKPKGNLSQLPGISRWQILRLEEEGIDSMAALANVNHKLLQKNIPCLSRLAEYWMDIARLYTIVGHDAYTKVKDYCQTASEFVSEYKNETFAAHINELEGVSSASEIGRSIEKTFRLSHAEK